jgi:HAE1 family hydrophobic/amphiphilic exporter-1
VGSLSFLVAASLAGAHAAAAAELDLAATVDRALRRNPGLLAVEELRSEVAGGIREARADAFPQITIVSSWSQSRSPAILNSPDFEEIIQQFPGGAFDPATQELYRTVVEIGQPVWTFGKVGAAIDLARIVGEAADAQIETARLDTASDSAAAYFQVLSSREGLATIEAETEYRQRDLDRIEDLLEIGEATELERLRARSARAEVEPEIARRHGLVEVAETRLRQILDLAPDEPLELAGAENELAEPPTLDRLIIVALESRPELRDLDQQLAIYDKRKRITRADGLPQVDLNGSWGREVLDPDRFSNGLYDAWAVSLEMRWELFDGGRRKGQIAQLESQRQQLALRRAELQSLIRLENRQALSDYATARARAAAAEIAASTAGEAVRVARESYEQGVATQTDLLDAQSRAISAEVLAVEAFYDALVQAALLTRAAGLLPTASWDSLPES